MKKLILLAFILLGGIRANSQCAKIDIILIVDQSGSVASENYLIREALEGFIEPLVLDDNGIKVSIITFNYSATVLHSLSSDKGSLMNSIEYVKYATGGTYMDEAFVAASEEFTKNGRFDSKKVIIVISDGSPSQIYFAEEELDNLKIMHSPIVFGVLIKTGETNESFMRNISTNGCYLETKWNLLVNELSKLNLCL